MNCLITTIAEEISDEDLLFMIQRAGKHRGGKSAKYPSLERHRPTVVKMMKHDLPLTHILLWLKEKHGEQLVLNTLRKYIVTYIGREAYDDYLKRNGWMKSRRKPQPGAPPPTNAALGDPISGCGKGKERPTEKGLYEEANQPPPPKSKIVTVADMKEGLRTTSIDPSEFDN